MTTLLSSELDSSCAFQHQLFYITMNHWSSPSQVMISSHMLQPGLEPRTLGLNQEPSTLVRSKLSVVHAIDYWVMETQVRGQTGIWMSTFVRPVLIIISYKSSRSSCYKDTVRLESRIKRCNCLKKNPDKMLAI